MDLLSNVLQALKQGAFDDSAEPILEEEAEPGKCIGCREKAAVAADLKHASSIFLCPLDLAATLEAKAFPKSTTESQFLLSVMKDHVLFEELTDDDLRVLIDATEKLTMERGEQVVRGNGLGEYLYVVQDGSLDVYCGRSERAAGQVTRGEVLFGQNRLLCGGAPCTTGTVKNRTRGTLWRVDQMTFRQIFAKRAHTQETEILACLEKIDLFSGMHPCKLQKFASSVSRVRFSEGDHIITKGGIGEMFYIIDSGSVRVHDIGIGDSQASDQILKKGDSFGERALLTGEPRVATVTAMTDVVCLTMDRETFRQSVGDLQELIEFRGKLQSLQSLPIFSGSDVTTAELERLAELAVGVCYRKGAKLCETGKPYPSKVWFIRSGQVLVYGGRTGKIYNLQSGDYFGEKSILGDLYHIGSHEATCEEKVNAWVLSREAIESVIVDLKRLGESGTYVKTKPQRPIKSLQDLTLRRKLGQGGFGKVFLVESTAQSTAYALKVINKRKLLEHKQERGVLREKEFLQLLHHPFILSMVSSFQDTSNLYLVMPLVQGGELFGVVAAQVEHTKRGLRNEDAAFYAAGIIEALGHFHHRYIAYRDLKLENVMIDASGYIKVVDLGLPRLSSINLTRFVEHLITWLLK